MKIFLRKFWLRRIKWEVNSISIQQEWQELIMSGKL